MILIYLIVVSSLFVSSQKPQHFEFQPSFLILFPIRKESLTQPSSLLSSVFLGINQTELRSGMDSKKSLGGKTIDIASIVRKLNPLKVFEKKGKGKQLIKLKKVLLSQPLPIQKPKQKVIKSHLKHSGSGKQNKVLLNQPLPQTPKPNSFFEPLRKVFTQKPKSKSKYNKIVIQPLNQNTISTEPYFNLLLNNDIKATKLFNTDCLSAHNKERQSRGLNPMKWNTVFANIAQSNANIQVKTYDETGQAPQHIGKGHGETENLWMIPFNGHNPLDLTCGRVVSEYWVRQEEIVYNLLGRPGVDSTHPDFIKWGHYTQVMWSNAKEVGCASSFSGGSWLVNCIYDVGNEIGRVPF